MYPWKTVLSIDEDNSRAKYLQIVDKIIKEASIGHLRPGQKMPGSRKLADLLKLNRKTVIFAYDELIAQGWLEVRSSSGTYISLHLPLSRFSKIQDESLHAHKKLRVNNHLSFIPDYSPIPSSALRFDGGSPDPRLAPIDWLYKECKSLVKSRNGYKLLSYADIHGDPVLRQTLAKYLSETRGINVTSENILITRGSQMGIFITMSSLIIKGDIVVVGSSSYDAADWTIQNCGGSLVRVMVDEEGINTEELERLCIKSEIKMIYITPHHHFPTTVTLSNSRRVKLLQLALKYNFTILEDDYDYDFHYESSPILPLASLNPGGQVIYVGSFSKVFAPNIRVGYLVCDEEYIEQFSKIRRIIDRQGDHVMQRAIAEAIKSGELTRHLKKSLKSYHKRRDHLAGLLTNNLAEHIAFKLPEGGMSIWVKFLKVSLVDLEPIINAMGLYMDIDQDLAIKYNALRIGFASISEEEQDKAIEILTKGVKQLASSASS